MFSPGNKLTACGMWSTTYIIALSIVVVLICVGLYLSRNMDKKNVKKVITIMAIWTIISEIIKMIFTGVTYGVKEVDFLPLYFCSLFMFCTVFSVVPNEKLNKMGLSFLFYGGIIGATAFFIYPSACIPNYPIYHFMCIRTMLYHGSMIYTGILIVLTGYYKPNVKDFKYYVVELSIVCILAYIINVLFDKNLMYMQEPLGFNLSKIIYNKIPTIYPFIFMILEIVCPFFISNLVYSVIQKISRREK